MKAYSTFLILAFSLIPGVQSQDFFDGRHSFTHSAHPQFDLNYEGTVEFEVAASWQEDPGYNPCILAVRNATYARFSFHITRDRKYISFWNGRQAKFLPYDFRHGRLVHVALVTEGESTEVFVEGASIGTMPIGYGVHTDLPLHIGSSDGKAEAFRGKIRNVRIFNKALTAQVLQANRACGHPALFEDGYHLPEVSHHTVSISNKGTYIADVRIEYQRAAEPQGLYTQHPFHTHLVGYSYLLNRVTGKIGFHLRPNDLTYMPTVKTLHDVESIEKPEAQLVLEGAYEWVRVFVNAHTLLIWDQAKQIYFESFAPTPFQDHIHIALSGSYTRPCVSTHQEASR